MRFIKPNLRVVDMCKYIDDNIYTIELTEQEKNKIYQYLYFIIYAITDNKDVLFYEEDVDSFANFLAEQIYNRLTDPRQFGDNPKLDRVVSCKNYINSVLYGRMLVWQQKYKFSEVLEDINFKEENVYGNYIDTALYRSMLKEEKDMADRHNIETLVNGEIQELPKLVMKVCSTTPYRSDDLMVHRLYMSCLLSFLNQVTFDNETQKALDERNESGKLYDYYVTRCRIRTLDSPIILWHLPDSMSDFVKVLLNRIKKMFTEEVYAIVKKFEVDDNTFDYILASQEKREIG